MARSDQSAKTSSPPASAAGDDWSDLPLPLRECGEIAALRLSSALSEALTQAADALFKDGTHALTHHEREALVDAADFARQHRRGMVYDFMKHFEQRYLRACRRKPNTLLGHIIDFDVTELKIVEHHLLDDSLEPGKITEAIQNSSWKTLQMLTSLYRDLLECQDLMPSDLPLGPKVIEAAVSAAILDQPWRHKAKHYLANALRWGLAARVNLLYRDLVDLLSARDLKAFAGAENGTSKEESKPSPPADAQIEPMPADAGAQGSGSDPTTLSAATQVQASATDAAQREVARCMGAARLPMPVEEFLTKHWRDHLAKIHFSYGEDSLSWREGVRTMDDLAWSLSSISNQEDYARLKEGFPNLLRRLSVGMDALALPPATRDRFLILLVQHHSEIVQSFESRGDSVQTDQIPAAGRPISAQAGAMPEQRPDWAMTSPASQPETQPPSETQAIIPALTDLKVGTWLEFQDHDGRTSQLKLAWISPHRNLYLLTNRQGERVLSLKAENFSKRLQDGMARLAQPAQVSSGSPGIASLNSSQKTA